MKMNQKWRRETMKPCNDCRKVLSTRAKACPHCGSSRPNGYGFKHFTLVLCALLIVWGIFDLYRTELLILLLEFLIAIPQL